MSLRRSCIAANCDGEGRRTGVGIRRKDRRGGLRSTARAAAGSYYASPVAANGNIYLTSLNEGIVTVLKAGAPKPEAVAENPPLGERVAATPAIADDTLYVRTAEHLYAFAEK